MAGESPDRSKQRESSARRTSGSASPVPEARSEAADPRLAVARDAEKSSARGGADTATRVLSTRTAEDPKHTGRATGDSEPETDADRGESDSDTEGAAGDAGRPAGDSDTEESVADAGQGVSDSDTEGAAGDAGRAAGDSDTEESVADAGRGASDSDTEDAAADAGRAVGVSDTEDADGSAGRGASDSGTESATAGAAGDAGRSGSDSDAEDAAGDAERGAGAADSERNAGDSDTEDAAAGARKGASGSSEESGADRAASDAGGSDGRLRDAVAAWVASAEGGEESAAAKGDAEDSEEGREAAERTPTEADTDGQKAVKAARAPEAPSGTEDADRSAESGGDGEKGPAAEAADNGTADTDRREDESDEPAQDAADEADEPEADRSATGGRTGAAEADEKTGDEASKPADPRVSGDAKTAPKAPDAKDAAKTAPKDTDATAARKAAPETPDDDAEDDARADGTAADKPGSGSTPAAGAATTGDKTPKPGAATGVAASDKPDGATADDDAPAEPPVDQPTAVFKVPRPSVDQPTTMLKIGGGTKDLPKSDLAKTDAPKTDVPKKDVPEKDAERTSKFVALKPLDDPAAKKPVAPAEATAPVPTVGPERTTQQPLPPKPPLDLLAELTNTPPPPETPLRTAARRVKIWTPLVLLLVVVFAVVQSVRPLPSPTLELTAKDSYTFEGGKVDIPWPADGQAALDVQGIGTFGSSGEQKPVPIASVAKVMTAYVILRDHPLKSGQDGPKILIDQAAEDQSDAGQESTVDVTKGDRITEREALESILIASANNVARLLARWDAGSEKAFVQKMNDAAKDLGMKNTTYTDPSGLNNTTVSTAVDQVKLAKAAMLQPAFREVATMMSYVDYKQKKHDNWNRLVGYNNVTGIKTGTTTSALGNLVFAARKDVNGEVHRIIGAVVRQPAGGPDNTILGAALHEGDKLIRAAQGALESATILKKGDVVGYADDGLGGRTPVAVTEDVTAVGWAGLSVKLTFAGDDLPHTAKAGTKVGTLTVGDGTTSAVKVPVALQKDLAEPGFAAKLTRLG
ncbi:D-alanyl-D-alanine carboxypeptidase [Streptomyces massasporeus]|uniref:D-alanyl-D-alanine carboxypeptidase n=1 Tax=Streptomyces massasporeus TaxID=67324 RepID=UPI003451D544